MRVFIVAYLTLTLTFFATVLFAESESCRGVDPVWKLKIDEDSADFDRRGKKTHFNIPLSTVAKGRSEARAFSLVGEFDTAILVISDDYCEDGKSKSSSVLTQQGSEAILLTGCCLSSK